eukprot:gene24202-biopygen2120
MATLCTRWRPTKDPAGTQDVGSREINIVPDRAKRRPSILRLFYVDFTWFYVDLTSILRGYVSDTSVTSVTSQGWRRSTECPIAQNMVVEFCDDFSSILRRFTPILRRFFRRFTSNLRQFYVDFTR